MCGSSEAVILVDECFPEFIYSLKSQGLGMIC